MLAFFPLPFISHHLGLVVGKLAGDQISHIFVGTNTIHWPPHSRLRQPCLLGPTRSQPYISLCHSQRCPARETSLRPTPPPHSPCLCSRHPLSSPARPTPQPGAYTSQQPPTPPSRLAKPSGSPNLLFSFSPLAGLQLRSNPDTPHPPPAQAAGQGGRDGRAPPPACTPRAFSRAFRGAGVPTSLSPLHLTACHPFPASRLSPKPAHEMCAVR